VSEELPVDSNELPPEGPTPTANEKPKVKSE
jgi:hypothetical protein